MEIPSHIKRFAMDEGFPKVVDAGRWKDFDLYVASDPEAPYIGPPQLILSKGDETRWASADETEAIMITEE